jgi:hypothetical protein
MDNFDKIMQVKGKTVYYNGAKIKEGKDGSSD